MRYSNLQTTWQEVPNQFSLVFAIVGCPLRCEGCHSATAWRTQIGDYLGEKEFQHFLDKYADFVSCVCFLGGEWHHDLLLSHLQKAKGYGLKTCLYTGLPHCMLSQSILQQLDFLKTGSWHKKLGGLDNPHTNQKFIDLNTNTNLTHLFTRTQSC